MRSDPHYPDDIRRWDHHPGSPLYRERPEDKQAAADEARSSILMPAAEALLALCDRHDGDSGEDADLIEALAADIDDLAARIRAALGEPRTLRFGVLVPVGSAPDA